MRGNPHSYQAIAHEDPGYDPGPPEIFTVQPGRATEPGECNVVRVTTNGWEFVGHLEEMDLEDLWEGNY